MLRSEPEPTDSPLLKCDLFLSNSSPGGGLLTEELKPRAGLPPLLVNLAERPAERLHYLGVSFGLTQVREAARQWLGCNSGLLWAQVGRLRCRLPRVFTIVFMLLSWRVLACPVLAPIAPRPCTHTFAGPLLLLAPLRLPARLPAADAQRCDRQAHPHACSAVRPADVPVPHVLLHLQRSQWSTMRKCTHAAPVHSLTKPATPNRPPPPCAGEHTVIMLRPLRSPDVVDTAWLAPFVTDFRGRFMQLLAGAFSNGCSHNC